MNVTCPNCATVYRVDPAKVPEAAAQLKLTAPDLVGLDVRQMAEGERMAGRGW